MSFWNEPIKLSRLWRGPCLKTPFATYACIGFCRLLVVAVILVLTVFVLVLLASEVMLAVHEPAMALAIWSIVGAVFFHSVRKARAKRRPHDSDDPDDPDDPTEGTGIPIPRIPPPVLRVGANEQEFPRDRRRFG